MKLLPILAFALGASMAHAVTINAVYFGQTHVLKATDSYFGLVANRESLIKVHVTDPAAPASPAVSATLTLSGQPNLVLPLTGPATLPTSIPDGLGVVQHSFSNTFTGYIPAAYVKKGLQIVVNAGTASTTLTNLDIGAPTKLIMTMTDVQFFSDTNGDYPTGLFTELEAKLPVADLEVRRLKHVVFPELVIPPRSDVGAMAVRVKSQADYTAQTGLGFDGEQAASGAWNGALKRAAGQSGRWSLFYLNIYNAGGNTAGGEAGGFSGVGLGTSEGILHHELGHALSLPHWGDNAAYPYKGSLYGITAPNIYNGTHAGPAWAFSLPTKAFIPCTTQTGNAGGKPVGTYKADPMQGGGTGYQEPAYLLNHFSDYSVDKMRTYLQSQVVVWNSTLNSWAQWNQTTGDYTTTISNNGVQFPTTRDTQVISIMASMSGANPAVNMVYPPIGPYTSGMIRLFDPTVAADRTAAQSIFSPTSGSDYCVRVVQGGVTKTYMLAASALTSPALTDPASLETEAINLPASGGTVTKIELLSTPNVEDVGLPANPTVLYTWAPLTPDPASFETSPVAYGSSAVIMKATAGELAFGYSGTVEYLFTETSGNPGGTSSAWQTSRAYTDIGLQPGTQYSYTVSMRAGTNATTTSAAASAVTYAAPATTAVTVDSTQQFSLQTGNGTKSVTGLGTFDAGSSDKLVVVISTEDANNAGTGFVYSVRYNGKVMIEAIQEDAGSGDGTAAIFYLDYPGAIGGGTIQVSAENPNGGIGCAYALSNTMPGFAVSNTNTGTAANSVALTTAGDRSVVIAVIDNAGKPNTSGTPTATTTSPSSLTQASSGSWGSQWGGHASGYRLVTSPTAITPAFSTSIGTGYSINIAAVEFPAQPLLPNRWIQTVGGAQNWTTATNWEDGVVPNPTATTTMDFSSVNIAANTSLNLGANRTAQLWKFGDTSGSQKWTVSSGFTMTLAGTTPGIQVNNNIAQLDCVVGGTAGLAKTGAGNLTLTGANTYTGATTITAGALQIGSGSTTGSLAATSAITNNAAMTFNRSNTVTQGTDFASVIAGTGTLAKSGTGTLILTGSNTYTGDTTITAGTLQIGSGGTTGTLSASSAITNNAALVFNRSNTVNQSSGFAAAITGTGSLTNIGTGTITFNSANTYAGLTTVDSGAFKVLHANALGTTAAGTVVNGTTTGSTANARLELEGDITVTGEPLTITGVGNFYGALSSTSGSNTWAGNVTIGAAGTRLGSTTGATLTVSGVIDSGAVNTGLVIRTQDLTAIVILSGANTYLGDTNLLIGELQLAGADNRLPVASRLMLGNTTSFAEFDLNGRNQEIAGLTINSGATAANNSVNNSSLTLSTLTVNTASPSSFAGILKGNLALLKTGVDTLTISGLSATAANNYSGTTTIGAGTLAIAAINPSLTGGLIFGSANASATFGTLDLGTSSATFAGNGLVRTNNVTASTVLIGSAKTLTLNGGLTLGYDAAGGTGQTDSRLNVTGAGTMAVNGTTINISANQAATNAAYWNAAILDASALASFNTNVTNFNIGLGSTTPGPGNVILSNTSNTILATTLVVGDTGGNNGRGLSTLTLGTGNNAIQVDTIRIGRGKGSGNGTVTFVSQTVSSPGTVTIANKAGSGGALIEIGNVNAVATGGGASGTLDLRGHVATVTASTLLMGQTNASSNSASTSGTVSFDAGTFTVGTLNMGLKTGASTGTAAGTLNVGGGSFTVNTAFTLGSQATGGASVATLNLTGGTFASNANIVDGGGTTTSTITLDGGTLNMTGKNIGGATAIDVLNFRSGTLSNVAAINGTGGLSKTTNGTLFLSGINTYSGTTTISAGTLTLGSNNALPATPLVIGSATLNAATFTNTLGTLDTSGSAVIQLGSGSALAFADSSTIDWTGGTLTLTGTFVSGASLRFGTTYSALTPAQLALISKPGGGAVALNSSGYLVDAGYSTWASLNAPSGTARDDFDNDGVGNAVEYILGGNKTTKDLSKLPAISLSGANMLFTFKRDRSSINSTTALAIEVGTSLTAWPNSYIVGISTTTSSSGVTVLENIPTGFDTITLSFPQSPDLRKFARIKVSLLP